MNAENLTIELDASPADLRPTCQVDYASRAVGAFTSASLLRFDEWDSKVEPGLLVAAESDVTHRTWRLQPRRDNLWSSGRAMAVDEIARSLALPKTDSLGRSMRSGIKRVDVEDGNIIVELTHSLACFPSMLAADTFAPVPCYGELAGETSGPYTVVGGGYARSVGLVRNEVGTRAWPDGPEVIVFIVSDSPHQGVKFFERGLIDITSNPNLPNEFLEKYWHTDLIRQRDLLMAGVLLSGPALRVSAARAFRRRLHAAIPREEIARSSHGSLFPLYDLVDLWSGSMIPSPQVDDLDYQNEKFLFGRDQPLTIAYADFEPNGDVVGHIAEVFASKLDISVISKPLSYGEYLTCLSSPDCDFIYSLIQPPFNDPTSMLDSVRSFGQPSGDGSVVQDAILKAQSTLDPQERLEASRSAAALMMKDMSVIPVVRARSKCLVSHKGKRLTLGADGLFRPPCDREACV